PAGFAVTSLGAGGLAATAGLVFSTACGLGTLGATASRSSIFSPPAMVQRALNVSSGMVSGMKRTSPLHMMANVPRLPLYSAQTKGRTLSVSETPRSVLPPPASQQVV